ncbi:MAG: YhcH/YjgK/YiaL family protein [Prolixibacteraceae bacterium]|jgi:YhcH/YjgK/YiaL family protein|nr:YhcH/YjgK/YiaL family protein [Prolixibacteraceae bacterium]
MAIFGTLDQVIAQVPNNELLQKGLEFLKNSDLSSFFDKVEDGNSYTHEIEGKRLFASFQQYTTKQPEVPNFEGHHKYIDIQFIFEGEEFIHNGSVTDILTQAEYDDQKDLYFPSLKNYSSIRMDRGFAAVLFPSDIHAPCQTIGDQPTVVKKIVVKVAVK